MIKNVWLVMNQSAVNALWGSSPLSTSLEVYPNVSMKRGGWPDVTPNEVVHIIGENDDLLDFTSANAADIVSADGWIQGPGFDDLDDFTTDPTRVLNLMPDLPGGGSPTFQNPNWNHCYIGQEPEKLIFAGQFTDEFSQEFL